MALDASPEKWEAASCGTKHQEADGGGHKTYTTHSKTIAFIRKFCAGRGHRISKLMSAGGHNWWHTIALAFGMGTLLTGVKSRAAKLVPQSPPSPL